MTTVVMSRVSSSRASMRTESSMSSASSIPRMDSLKTQFDIWSLIKRGTCESTFSTVTKFRLNKPLIRSNSAKVIRKRKCGDTGKHVDVGSRSSSSMSDTSFEWDNFDDDDDVFGMMEGFLNKPRNKSRGPLVTIFDSMDIPYLEEVASSGSRVQKMYLKKCSDFQIAPSTIFVKGLNSGVIDLAHHNIGRKGAHACAIALTKATGVHTLNMADNDLGPGGARHIAQVLQENTHISDMTLSDNHMRVEGFTHIANVVIEFDKVYRLDLSNNGFTENDAPIFKQMLEETRNMKYLNLSHNEFRENGGMLIGEALSWNDSLTDLDLSWNHFRRSGAIGIADGLLDNTSLEVLNLAWNGCYLEGCMAFSRCLTHNTVLRVLDLSNNRIDRECIEWLTKGLAKNNTLKTLILKFNPLTSEGANDILKFIVGCPTSGISKLDLGVQQVQSNFVVMLNELHLKGRKLEVVYGHVVGHVVVDDGEDELHLLEENPAVVLIEFGKLMGFRLYDLFCSLDTNGNRALDKREIANGLKMANIPLSEKCLQKLILKLDTNRDGDIDFGELLVAQQIHRQEVAKSIAAQRRAGASLEDSSILKIREKLQQLMAKKMGDYPAFQRSSRLLVKQIQDRKMKLEEELVYSPSAPSTTIGARASSPATTIEYGDSRPHSPESLQVIDDAEDTFGHFFTRRAFPDNVSEQDTASIGDNEANVNSRPKPKPRAILRKMPSVHLPIRRNDIAWFYSTDSDYRPRQMQEKPTNSDNESDAEAKGDEDDSSPEVEHQEAMQSKDIQNILLKQSDTNDYESYARKSQHDQDMVIENMAVKQLQEAAETRNKHLSISKEKTIPWERDKKLGANGNKRLNNDKTKPISTKGTKRSGHSKVFQRRWTSSALLEHQRVTPQNKTQLDLPTLSVEEFD